MDNKEAKAIIVSMANDIAKVLRLHIFKDMERCRLFKEQYMALVMAIEALDKQIKYRWHDLRKNPEDLPSCNCYCCVLVEDGEYAICEYSVDCKRFGETVTEKHYELQSEPVESWFEGFDEDFITIAWRYIEPFEK